MLGSWVADDELKVTRFLWLNNNNLRTDCVNATRTGPCNDEDNQPCMGISYRHYVYKFLFYL